MEPIDIKTLSPEQRAKLSTDLATAEAADKQRVADERERYKTLVDDTVKEQFQKLEAASQALMAAKTAVFNSFEAVIGLKNDLFKVKNNRQTDTFTTANGAITITLGNRMYEGWDDTVNVGIQKVQDFVKTLARDDNSAALVETVMRLVSKDRKGNLKASKVLELEKLAIKTGDADFLDGIKIIKDAYRPVPSCQFVAVSYKDIEGKEHSLPLSMSAID